MELLPIDSRGEPAGRSDAAERIRPPVGISNDEWFKMIELAAAHFRMTSGVAGFNAEAVKAMDVASEIDEAKWDLVFNFPHNWKVFASALEVRGVLPVGNSLTPQENLVIDILTNLADHSSLTTKLKKAGVTQAKFQSMMLHKPFAESYKLRAEQTLASAAPLVTMSLSQMAVHERNLNAIEYFDKRVGRHPDKKEQIDGFAIVNTVIDVLTKFLSKDHPDILRSVAAELEVRLKLNGNSNNPNGTE